MNRKFSATPSDRLQLLDKAASDIPNHTFSKIKFRRKVQRIFEHNITPSYMPQAAFIIHT